MKRLQLSVLFLLIVGSWTQAQQPKAYVDERTELMSIVFRLAEVREYVNKGVASYDKTVDSLFAPFKADPLIDYAKEVRKQYAVAYDAVMDYALHTEIKDGTISFNADIIDKQMYGGNGLSHEKFRMYFLKGQMENLF